jgi:hypothetical protein
VIAHYYHALGPLLSAGDVLVSLPVPAAGAPPLALLADRFAPEGGPERLRAQYLPMLPDGFFAHGPANFERIYRVAPVGGEKRLDDSWLDSVSELVLGDYETVHSRDLDFLRRYWRGERSPRFRGWRVLCRCFVVTGQLSPPDLARAETTLPPPPLEPELVTPIVLALSGAAIETDIGRRLALLARRALARERRNL